MPFRLLGMVVDPDQAGALCGHTFARYASSGVDVTLLCTSALAWSRSRTDTVRYLGIHHVVLLDYASGELRKPGIDGTLADVMAGLRPHAVVIDGDQALVERSVTAFHEARRGGGSNTLPAKLYCRAPADSLVPVTTRISVAGHAAEHFIRIYPSPWVTGVLETDLFAGIREGGIEAPEQLLAS